MGELEAITTGLWSIVPPLLAIVLALLTKEVFSSLLIGLFSGMLIYAFSTGGSIVQAVYYMFQMMAEKLGSNGFLIIFLVLLGAMVFVVTKAGGSRAYGKWASKRISTKRGAKFSSSILGVLIFIDDYFNCLTVGTVMRPLTDRHKISREKLAYIIDATAAPICIIAPVSSWAAAVAGDLGDGGFNMFIQAIPYNLYALLTLVMVVYVCLSKFDFGPMRRAELAAADLPEADEEHDDVVDGMTVSKKGKVIDLVIPVVSLIVLCIAGMAYVGGFFDGGVDFIEAIGYDASAGLALGAFGALIVTLIMFVPRKLLTFKEFMSGLVEGAKSMIPAILILVFAWSLSGVCRGMIGTGEFVSGLISGSSIGLSLLPFIVFVVAAFLSFSMGTAWGTFGILLPIVTMICAGSPEGARVLIASMGATLAGSVFGDHCSPISDTTILSSAGAKCDHISHVSTQMPYAILVACVCAVGYLLAGFVSNPWIPLAVSVVVLFGAFAVINQMQKKKEM